jgi:hypothetical protein
MVKLQQFDSFGRGVKYHILNIGGQSANGWIVQWGKMYFFLIIFNVLIGSCHRIAKWGVC